MPNEYPVRTVREVLADVQRKARHAHQYSGGGTKDLASAVYDLAEMVRIVQAQLDAVARSVSAPSEGSSVPP